MADSTGQYRVLLQLDPADRTTLRLLDRDGRWRISP
jgi:hypothetical protein